MLVGCGCWLMHFGGRQISDFWCMQNRERERDNKTMGRVPWNMLYHQLSTDESMLNIWVMTNRIVAGEYINRKYWMHLIWHVCFWTPCFQQQYTTAMFFCSKVILFYTYLGSTPHQVTVTIYRDRFIAFIKRLFFFARDYSTAKIDVPSFVQGPYLKT